MNEWISVEDRLPSDETKVLCWYEYGDYNCICQTYGVGFYDTFFKSWCGLGHKARVIAWMSLPAPPEQYQLTLVDSNKMLWVNKEPFRCSCGGNVFSEYKDKDGKRVFECHGCKSKYEGE